MPVHPQVSFSNNLQSTAPVDQTDRGALAYAKRAQYSFKSDPANAPTNPTDMTESNIAASHNPRQQFNSDYDNVRKGNCVASHFKDRMFEGDITQSIDHLLPDYENCDRQVKLNATEMAHFFVHVLKEPARSFFYDNFQHGMTYGDIANMMQKEFNSDARELHTLQEFDTLTFMKCMEEKKSPVHLLV